MPGASGPLSDAIKGPCPHCGSTWFNYRTKDGDYYCRSCKKRFPARVVLPPTRRYNTWRRKGSSPTTITDQIISRITRRIYPLDKPEEEK